MKKKEKKLYIQQKKRALKKVFGTKERPRLAVYRSHKHIYAQLINDNERITLAFSSTLENDIKEKFEALATREAAFVVGSNLAKKAKTCSPSIQRVVFDRGDRPYHGRIKSLAEGARKEGLLF